MGLPWLLLGVKSFFCQGNTIDKTLIFYLTLKSGFVWLAHVKRELHHKHASQEWSPVLHNILSVRKTSHNTTIYSWSPHLYIHECPSLREGKILSLLHKTWGSHCINISTSSFYFSLDLEQIYHDNSPHLPNGKRSIVYKQMISFIINQNY
jgi:hypothetical protein